MAKPLVGVFFGSRSAEHDVSIITAIAAIIKPLKLSDKYDVLPVYITKEGRWYAHEHLGDIDLYSSGKIDDFLRKLKPARLRFENGLILEQPGLGGRKFHIDVAFPATHGTHGEDGHLMGVFEMAGIPYVGCDVASSAISMNKVLSKVVAQAHGVLTPSFIYFTAHGFEVDRIKLLRDINEKLNYPLFVKPAHLGSSIAITKVNDKRDLENAIEVAAHYDDLILVEEGVKNLTEVTQPIIGNEELTLAMLEEPVLSSEGVFDFETKYLNKGKGGKKMGANDQGAQGYSKIPAPITKALYETAQTMAQQVYRAVGCEGIARIDMLIDNKAKKVYFNEINPLPGSLYVHNWRKTGMSDILLVERLIELAYERQRRKTAFATIFSTNFLQQFE